MTVLLVICAAVIVGSFVGVVAVQIGDARQGLHQLMWGSGPRRPELIPGTPEYQSAHDPASVVLIPLDDDHTVGGAE